MKSRTHLLLLLVQFLPCADHRSSSSDISVAKLICIYSLLNVSSKYRKPIKRSSRNQLGSEKPPSGGNNAVETSEAEPWIIYASLAA